MQVETAFSGSWFIQLAKKHRLFLSLQVQTRAHEIPAQNYDNYGDDGINRAKYQRAGQSGVRIPAGARGFLFSKNVHTVSGSYQPPI